MLAASGWPKMPKTPHSSLNLSNMGLMPPASRNIVHRVRPRALRVGDWRRVDRRCCSAHRQSAIDSPPVRADHSSPVPRPPSRAASTPSTACCATEITPRRGFAKERRRTVRSSALAAPPSTASIDDVRADAAGVESAFRERHREAAVGAIVRRAHQTARPRAATSSVCSARSRLQVERRRPPCTRPCATFRYSLPPSSPRPSPSSTIASPARSKRAARPRDPRVRAGRRRR